MDFLELEYSNEEIAIACSFFQWLCEKENKRNAVRRFTPSDLEQRKVDHAECTQIFSDGLQKENVTERVQAWFNFQNFCDDKGLDAKQFENKRETLSYLLTQAALQYHLIYYDLLSNAPHIQFQFPIFESTWQELNEKYLQQRKTSEAEERKPPGRPGLDYQWLRKRLDELYQEGLLPDLEGHWRSNVAELLRSEYMEKYPGSKPRQEPKMETIRDKMRNDFEALKGRYSKE